MKRTLGALYAVVVLATMLFLATISKHAVPAVHAQSGCAVATLRGGYGFVTLNSFFAKNPHAHFLPEADVGLITFDGAGNLSTSFTDSSNGAVAPFTDTGTYTVNPDCAGTVTLTNLGVHLNIVIVSGGTEIFGIQTDPGPTTTVDFKKQ